MSDGDHFDEEIGTFGDIDWIREGLNDPYPDPESDENISFADWEPGDGYVSTINDGDNADKDDKYTHR